MVLYEWGAYYYPKTIAVLTPSMTDKNSIVFLYIYKTIFLLIERANNDFNLFNIIAVRLTKQVVQKSLFIHLSNLLHLILINHQ